jgi:peptidoglycan/xylan/chitin deacetylase (PgdA/CDA1 family)
MQYGPGFSSGLEMDSGLARIVSLWAAPLALCCSLVAANAGECPGNPDALGTSRTIVVDPRDHIRIGTMDYAETLPLLAREVVLTFDDGPIPPYTNRILDILAADCVKATYFIVGDMAKEYPALVRRVYDAGHTVGTHSMSHPLRFRALSVERGNAQIDNGIAATAAALGDAGKVAPFFRFPGFGHTEAAHEHAAEQGLMVWGADFPADDWTRIGAREVARRALHRLEVKGKGVLLLHDIHQRTVDALPIILAELKARGFRVVHVVPSSAERPATVTAAADWRPGSRPNLPPPVILIAEVQDPEGNSIARKTAMELCSLNPPMTTGMASRRQSRAMRVAHMHSHKEAHTHRHKEAAPSKVASLKVGPIKGMQAKGKAASKVAHAETAPAPIRKSDVHAIP